MYTHRADTDGQRKAHLPEGGPCYDRSQGRLSVKTVIHIKFAGPFRSTCSDRLEQKYHVFERKREYSIISLTPSNKAFASSLVIEYLPLKYLAFFRKL